MVFFLIGANLYFSDTWPTATAKDPPTAKSPTMHSKLVCQDKSCCLGKIVHTRKNPKKKFNTEFVSNPYNKKDFSVLKFKLYTLQSEVSSSLGSGSNKRGQSDTETDIATYRLNRPRG